MGLNQSSNNSVVIRIKSKSEIVQMEVDINTNFSIIASIYSEKYLKLFSGGIEMFHKNKRISAEDTCKSLGINHNDMIVVKW